MTDYLETFPNITLIILVFCFGLTMLILQFPPLEIESTSMIFNTLHAVFTHWLGNLALALFMVYLIIKAIGVASQQRAGNAYMLLILFGFIVLLNTATTHGQLALFLT